MSEKEKPEPQGPPEQVPPSRPKPQGDIDQPGRGNPPPPPPPQNP